MLDSKKNAILVGLYEFYMTSYAKMIYVERFMNAPKTTHFQKQIKHGWKSYVNGGKKKATFTILFKVWLMDWLVQHKIQQQQDTSKWSVEFC